jgi:hypothetical protein
MLSFSMRRTRGLLSLPAVLALFGCLLTILSLHNVVGAQAWHDVSRTIFDRALYPLLSARDQFTPSKESVFCDHVRLGLRYVPSCFDQRPSRLYPLLITGTGRSGTKYTMSVLRSLGYNISHDDAKRIGSDGAVAWPLAVKGRGPYPKWASKPGKARFRALIHQVRDPLASIPSRAAHIKPLLEPFVVAQTPEMKRMAPAFRNNSMAVALLHYVTWNSLIEKQHPDFRFRVEHLNSTILMTILRAARLPLPKRDRPSFDEVLREANRATNSEHVKAHEDVTWPGLFRIHSGLAQQAYDMAIRYGYNYTSSGQSLFPSHIFDLSG